MPLFIMPLCLLSPSFCSSFCPSAAGIACCKLQEDHGSGGWTSDGGEVQAAAVVMAAAVVAAAAARVLVRHAASSECITAGR